MSKPLYQPLISVVTVVYNSEKYIEQTITSVLNQNYKNIEYIVIDGGSTDQTQEIIERYRYALDYYISKPDQGIADAMNKALQKVHGEYIMFLHADDYFADVDVLAYVFSQISSPEEMILCDILFGEKLQRRTSRGLNCWMNFKTGILHQGAFCNRSVFEQIGDFDQKFKIALDYDFFLRAYRAGIKAKKIPVVLSVMRDCGISSRGGWGDLMIRFNEEEKIHQKNLTLPLMRIVYAGYWFFYLKYRRIRFYMRTNT